MLLNKNKEENGDNIFDIPTRKQTPIKFILPLENENSYTRNLENYENVTFSNISVSNSSNSFNSSQDSKRKENIRKSIEKHELERQKLESLMNLKKEKLQSIAKLKRQMAEIEIQAEELNRDVSYSP